MPLKSAPLVLSFQGHQYPATSTTVSVTTATMALAPPAQPALLALTVQIVYACSVRQGHRHQPCQANSQIARVLQVSTRCPTEVVPFAPLERTKQPPVQARASRALHLHTLPAQTTGPWQQCTWRHAQPALKILTAPQAVVGCKNACACRVTQAISRACLVRQARTSFQ